MSDRTPSPVAQAAAHRRTFAIISHPDAGKTTLTEKLLLMGGAIHLAGEVKAKGERRRARSDWMKIEQQRGISVTTSVMTFEYGGCTFNLLDTPGHEDFSEDTYRTLTAVDSAVMVIDAAKGIEPQTLKLFEVCRLRDVPIMTFVNKFDREAKDPIELLDEIADKLQLEVAPANWPIGMGQNFRGVFDLRSRKVVLLTDGDGQIPEEVVDRRSNSLSTRVSEAQLEELDQTLELVEGALPSFDEASYREGHLTPAFFGSALKNFGVRALLDALAAHAPSPRAQASETREVEPEEDKVTGFVFKVQANMDPKHRDRVAFVRLCSGRFQRGMKLTMVRHGKQLAVSNPIMFFARERELAEEAWPGDIIGVPNHGQLRVGDALTEGEPVRFTGIPNFAPEILMRVRLGDPMRAKHLQEGARGPGRGGRDPGLPPLHRRRLDRGRGRPAPARRAEDAPRRGVRPADRLRARPLHHRPLVLGRGAARARPLRRDQALGPGRGPRRQPRLPRPQRLGPRPGPGGLPEGPLHRDPRAALVSPRTVPTGCASPSA